MSGYTAEKLTISSDDLYNDIVKNSFDDYIRNEIRNRARGDKVRNISYSGTSNNKTELGYRPLWMYEYLYKDKEYLGIINGANSEEIEGTRPSNSDLSGKNLLKNFMIAGFFILLLISFFVSDSEVMMPILIIYAVVLFAYLIFFYSKKGQNKDSCVQKREMILSSPDDFINRIS